ncbi:hypothetical protein HHK36_000202 [Tetracentron sinense]|uniref:BHLH domain-containing protein n=1 Tax=Tetracentron sinense TaxID=13715 RepID=A0A834ZTQ1_TETSI|nr:hypothetical protein HHK36_000202 [Tetracentron sinense]
MTLEKLNPAAECEPQLKSAPQAFLFSLPTYTPKEEDGFDQDGVKELHEDLIMGSSSNGFDPNQETEDSFTLEGINGGDSKFQSRKFMDDEFSNCLHGSMNSSDCILQTFVNSEKAISSPKGRKLSNLHLQDLQECKHTKLSPLDIETKDLHYTKTLSSIFKNSHRLIIAPCFYNGNHKTSFISWKKGGLVGSQKPQIGKPQRILKKILFEVSWMHGGFSLKFREENGKNNRQWSPKWDNIGMNHVLLERIRRENLNENFLVLRSLAPSISKEDRESILSNTIAYLKELGTRVEELESCMELSKFEAREKRNPDIVEQISGNYGNKKITNGKKIKKRKACDIDKMSPELNLVTVSLVEKEVLIEIRCSWRECLLLDIMDTISILHLDAHSVQSSTINGILNLTIKSKFRGAAVASAGKIEQALQRVASQ